MICRHTLQSGSTVASSQNPLRLGLAVGLLALMLVYPIASYGQDAPRTWVVGKDVPRLEEAVAKARAGDIIELPAGEYRLQKPLGGEQVVDIAGRGSSSEQGPVRGRGVGVTIGK